MLANVLAENSIDAVVTDPPYDLTSIVQRYGAEDAVPTKNPVYARVTRGFMGKEWDGTGVAFDPETWRQVLRVLKPGGHLLSFGGTRTYHRMACAIEDAGFEVRDSLHWFYGTGFPKSLNVSKAIDEAAGAQRKVVGRNPNWRDPVANSEHHARWNNAVISGDITEAATAVAAQWEGWGTALKPGHEPIVLARKPVEGTVAANVTRYGTGALNIDVCRIGTTKAVPASPRGQQDRIFGKYGAQTGEESGHDPNVGRWPANVLLDEGAAAELDMQSGERKSGAMAAGTRAGVKGLVYAPDAGRPLAKDIESSSGGASRFFYVAKPSRAERDHGCDDLPALTGGQATDRVDGTAGLNNPRAGQGRTGGARNGHPTVKPTALMRYLVRLVTPPGGTVLDPFMGSGTTGRAAVLEDLGFVGIEISAEYMEIARRRIQAVIDEGEQRARAG